MTARVLPAPEVFASCPLDGKILQHYAGTFEAVYVSLNPFIRPVGIDSAEFKPGTYPNRASIVKNCEPVLWSEVLQQTNLPSIAAVDIALRPKLGDFARTSKTRTMLRQLKHWQCPKASCHPTKACSQSYFTTASLSQYKVLAMSGFGLAMSSTRKENCVGSKTSKVKKTASPWVASMYLLLISSCCGRSTGTVISHFFVRRTKD
jgi:hypothetical protein